MPADLTCFHPLVRRWFSGCFEAPTEAQRRGWPEIVAGRNTLIAAPTGSGKTLAAFLAGIDRLLRAGLEGPLPDATRILYISPLKALSNDVRRNLETPLDGIAALAAEDGEALPEIRALVRTGDTPSSQRQGMLRRPPHILVTTPESLYLLLTGRKSREMLRPVRVVIIDEIHALARDKRGSHLALSLERLAALCERPPQRIGLSATQRPIDEIARFLVGSRAQGERMPGGAEGERAPDQGADPPCSIIDAGHLRALDLAIETPPGGLSAVCSHETWEKIYARLHELIEAHRSTLVFVNTRRLAERVAHHLSERLGEEAVASHHGSLARRTRLDAEERLKAGELPAIVATASLELGIDIGHVDLVCQIASPRSIATCLQRVGRAGHTLGVVPKGRLFPLTRDDLVECLALVRAIRGGRLDAIEIPRAPLDILAQQIVAIVAADEWEEEALYNLCRGAFPYRDLERADFDAAIELLSEGFAHGHRRGAWLHRDRIHRRLRARRGARLAAITSGGAIPEVADYRVVTEGEGTFVGTVNEDFVIESIAGDIFLLGNTSWRIRHARGGEVVVSDARGAPATVPFWVGEAPGRTLELSREVSELREEVERRLGDEGKDAAAAAEWLRAECGAGDSAATEAAAYIRAQKAAIGLIPTQRRVVFERFFDETGGMQLAIHAPFGTRINRAWGLALRKRFCRSYDFELQASAGDNGIVLSIGPQHSFATDSLFSVLRPDNGEGLLVQALLTVPMFLVRWRWNVTRALAVLRQKGGKKVPPPLQRFRGDDLLAAAFPRLTGCQENQVGEIPVPDHPMVRQTIHDCLTEAMDIEGWLAILRDVEEGRIELIARDTREPSPWSHELLNANPYAFLDNAPIEERRTRAVATRRALPMELDDLSRLDPRAIARVLEEARPLVRDADELHDTLLERCALPAEEGKRWRGWFDELLAAGRATEVRRQGAPALWIAAERRPLVAAALPGVEPHPSLELPQELQRDKPSAAHGRVELLRGRLLGAGPTTAPVLATELALPLEKVRAALEALEGEGVILRGRFSAESEAPTSGAPDAPDAPARPEAPEMEWCERGLLARIHRLTLEGLRRQVEPVEVADYLRFLEKHQRLGGALDGDRASVAQALLQLQGFEIPAGAWETEILPARVKDYDPAWLDDLTLTGELAWGRLSPPPRGDEQPRRGGPMTRAVPIALVKREDLPWLLPPAREPSEARLGGSARAVRDALREEGALFFTELQEATRLLGAELEDALGELIAAGWVSADGFAAVRALVSPDRKRIERARRRTRSRGRGPLRASRGGRWSRFPGRLPEVDREQRAERWAWQLLDRYGIVFRDLLTRESAALPWWSLAAIYRRLEARGEVRGGRFVTGVGGEQFALPEVVERLRRLRDQGAADEILVISAADPLNLAGIITPGRRVPALTGNRLLLRGGRPIAARIAGKVELLEELEASLVETCTRILTDPRAAATGAR